jgi:hypothetical protein
MSPAGLNVLKRTGTYINLYAPLKKTQPSCPCSRDLNWTGKGLNQQQKWVPGIAPGKKRRPVRRAKNVATFTCRLYRNSGTSISWSADSLSRQAQGLLYIYFPNSLKRNGDCKTCYNVQKTLIFSTDHICGFHRILLIITDHFPKY